MSDEFHQPLVFLRELGKQTQLLACLHWLSEFQIVACVPLTQDVAYNDLADMVGVPTVQLMRIIRFVATAGFLSEPRPGHVAHSTLSAHFFTTPSFLDGVDFLAETAMPTALHMPEATRFQGRGPKAGRSAYNIFAQTSMPFSTACQTRPKLRRQISAMQYLESDRMDSNVAEALSVLNWQTLGGATVVEVNAISTTAALALVESVPALKFVVQLDRTDKKDGEVRDDEQLQHERISVQRRTMGTPQSFTDAAVYVLHLPNSNYLAPSHSVTSRILSELRTHFDLLRAHPSATLIVTARLVPQPGQMEASAEAAMRLHDLFLLQMCGDQVLDMPLLLELIMSVRDETGSFVVLNKLSLPHHLVSILELRIQPTFSK